MKATDLHFDNCRLELKLEPQSPMIHFQANQTGATIRASEVKPKLDRYILDKLMKKENMTLDELKGSKDYKCIFQDKETGSDNHALKYKMQITCEEPPTQIIINHGIRNCNNQFKIYYGNSGKNPEDKYFGIISKPKIIFLCFQPKVCSLIVKYVKSFFLTTNFGTMQGKGFGSFAPAGYEQMLTERNKKEIAQYLKAKMNARYCFAISFDDQKHSKEQVAYWNKIFDEIRAFYSIMKSGRNSSKSGQDSSKSGQDSSKSGQDSSKSGQDLPDYLKAYIYLYMMNKGIKNEKAEIKQKGVAPILCKPTNIKKNGISNIKGKPRYVKAFLGTANQVTYGSRYKVDKDGKRCFVLDDKGKVIVKIESIQEDEKKIERFSSPIFFKIIKDTVFIVAGQIPEEMYGAKFKFKSHRQEVDISTPSKKDLGGQEFDTSEFLKEYVDYYNNLREKGKQKYRKVVEVE